MFAFDRVEGDPATRYQHLLRQAESLMEGERDWLANLANAASLLYHSLNQVNWAGFYLMKKEELVLGPFMGLPACIRIPISKGVCGTAVREKATQLVPDVLQFPGHIACDASTRSEIVIPLLVADRIVGVLDIDSPVPQRFDEEDRQYLERFAHLLVDKIDWAPLLEDEGVRHQT
ncbi:GAF domain-containing protein [Desmospora profundinema]|uniref:GAF domain-containing protein n=1 Tax=Desmospora profundinema TaxID=1571184 RepID=A0ABU1IKV3_9BACL|nr:GAF domain-containing protein [Desmospora profundinema]MDR6225321.1 GAF domain-containing protein [Desmospora profundinema]